MKKIVTIGGGTGSYTVLRGLKKYTDVDITAIVSMADDGGSTGVLRDELGVLPPGDVRQCLVALSEHSDIVRVLMNYRFEDGTLAGHAFGNIFLAALEKVAGSFAHGVEVASDILRIKGKVLPVTLDNAELRFVLSNGEVLEGENSVNHTDIQSVGVASYEFQKPVSISSATREAILNANIIVIGPGNLYCSIIPNLIVDGFKEVIQQSKARLVVPVNLTNKKGHTSGFGTKAYVALIESMLGRTVDYILVNNESPTEEQLIQYIAQEGEEVLVQNDMTGDVRILEVPLLSNETPQFSKTDAIQHMRSFIRHDSDKLAEAIYRV